MKLIVAIVRPFKVTDIVDGILGDAEFPGMTVVDCRGFGREKTAPHRRVPQEELTDFVDQVALLVAAPDGMVEDVVHRIETLARTGRGGDGKVFVLPLAEAVRIATGARGDKALE
ncbi:MAG: P-II family nitrogen regulator [Gemmatimonadales bacterium]